MCINARRDLPARPFAMLARAALFAALAGAGGCASPAAPEAAPATARRSARVEMINLSDCEWRVTIASPDGREARDLRLPARETLRIELAGGVYQITQTALSVLAGPGATRRFPAQLESGEIYRWRLATLFTAPVGAGP